MDNEKKITEKTKFVGDAEIAVLRKKTDDAIQGIFSVPNMEIPARAVVYYISNSLGDDSNAGTSPACPWKSIEKVNGAELHSGDYVCFKRGDLWRNVAMIAKEGVTYTAYGEGEKPKFYCSPEDGANPDKWQEVAPGIWTYEGAENMNDVGALVFNGGEAVSAKVTKLIAENRETGETVTYDFAKYSFSHPENNENYRFEGYRDLKDDLQLFHDTDFSLFVNGREFKYTGSKKLYLRSTSNPGLRFKSIEFNVGLNAISVRGDHVTMDNLCIKYCGIHGIGASGNVVPVTGLTVQNCEFGWIGGSAQYHHMGRHYQTRLGNAVEIYGACQDFTVRNNYIYQIYDTGMTVQANFYNVNNCIRQCLNMKNVNYLDNVVENCEMAFEIWLSDILPDNPSRMENYLVKGNLVWNTSYGFCEQRPVADQGWSAAVKNRCSYSGNRAYNYVIKDNLFAFWKNRALQCTSNLFNPEDGSDSLPFFTGNVFAERYGKKFGQVEIIQNHDAHADASAHIDSAYDDTAPQYLWCHTVQKSGAYLNPGHFDGTNELWFLK